mgnify:FL=1
MKSRYRSTDTGYALNKLKVKSIKVLKERLLHGSQSEQIASASAVLALLRAYEMPLDQEAV